MIISPPLCTFFKSRCTRLAPSIQHVVQHRRTTRLLALSILLDNAVVTVPMIVAIALGIPFIAVPAALILVIIAFRWNFAWISENSAVYSAFLWGGTIYIIEDASGILGFTTEVGIAEHPDVKGVVEAVIPGILFFLPAELRQFKPHFTYAQIPWEEAAIKAAIIRKHPYRPDWD